MSEVEIFHEHGAGGVCFWCPGCDQAHCVSSQWAIDRETLTISPSVLVGGVQWPANAAFFKPKHGGIPDGGRTICHSFVRGGRIEFLADSTHTLAGQTVDLPTWPIGGA